MYPFIMRVAILALWIFMANSVSLDMKQRVIVHLFEWRWSDIAEECEEFLAPLGFKGIQISPPNENVVVASRPWWERYQPVSYQLKTRSGNEEELKDMLKRCNKVGVRVIADVVFNHMAADTDSCQGTGGSSCDTKNLKYPGVPYSKEDFHTPECSINNYNNATNVRFCKLEGLHDLDQSNGYVQGKIVEYLNHLINIGVAGFRVDAAKHMSPADLQVIFSQLHDLNTNFGFKANTKPFIYMEVIDITGQEAVRYQEYTSLGLVTDFRYGYELGRCFQGRNNLKWLKNFGSEWNLLPGDKSIVFIENHDTERSNNNDVLSYKKHQNYKMAIAFMLAWEFSTPKILSSYEFSDFNQGPPHDTSFNILSPCPITGNICSNGWRCQHRWRQIYNMVKFHNVVQGTEVLNWWDNGKNQIAFCRGNKGFIAFNLEKYPLNKTVQTCLSAGTYCDIISGNIENHKCAGKTISVATDGSALITIDSFNPNSLVDGVLALHVEARLHWLDSKD